MTDPINVNFSDLARVMREIGKAHTEPKSPPSNEKVKVYAKIGDDNKLIIVEQKSDKNLSSEHLTQIIEKTIEATKEHFTEKISELGDLLSGLQALRQRITSFKNEMPPIKRFIFNLFGVFNKTDAQVKRIEKTIKVVQEYHLKNEIALLKKEITRLESQKNNLSLTELENQIANMKGELDSSTRVLEMEKSHLNELQQNYLEKPTEQLSDKIEKQTQKLEEAKKGYIQAKEAKETLGKVKGAKVPKLFGKENLAHNNYQNAKEKLKSAAIIAKKENEALKQLMIESKALKVKLEQNENEFLVHFNQLRNRIEIASHKVDKLTETLRENQSELKLRTDLEHKKALLNKKEAALAALTGKTISNQHLPISEVTSSLFTIPGIPGSPLHTRQVKLMNSIQSSLGLTENKEEHEVYLRKLIFGFSVGQNQTIEEMSRLDPSFNVEELRKILEGGTGLVNMFYVAHYLEQTSTQGKLLTDLKRSLPFALRLRAIELMTPISREKNLAQLLSDIKADLAQLKTGEVILLPVGTSEHETLLAFQKKEGGIETTYYNTGEGIDQNMTTGFKLKALTDFFSAGMSGKYPVKKTFPIAEISQIEPMLQAVLKNRMENGSIEDINTHIRNNLGDGISGEAKDVQLNGVCSFQVLSEAFQDMLGSEKSYLNFQHDFLNHLQNGFEKAIQNKIPSSELEERFNQKLLMDNQQEINRIGQKL